MFTKDECEALRRLTDGVIPMGWIAVHCGPAIGQMTIAIVECVFRDPDAGVPDKHAQVCISRHEYLDSANLPELIRTRFDIRLRPSEMVCL